MRTVANHIARMLDRPIEQIRLEELVEIDARLIKFIEGRHADHSTAVQNVFNKNLLLQHAKRLGWSCRSFALRESWTPIRVALRGKTHGALVIIESAVAHGIPASEFEERDMAVWRQEMRDKKRAPQTIQSTEMGFRVRMRLAKLQSLLPRLDLALRSPERYAKPLDTMEPSLRADFNAKLRWKSRQMVQGRKAKNVRSSPCAQKLGAILRQVCGYAEQELRMRKIHFLRDVLTPKVLGKMMDWLVHRGNKSSGIKPMFGKIYALLTQHPQYKKGDHSWLRDKIARLPREPRWQLDERLNARSIPYTQLAEVPRHIRAEIALSRDPLQKAWLQHDLLFFTWTLYHPWRNRNLRECGLYAPAHVNLIYEPLSLTLQHELDLPQAENQLLEEDQDSPAPPAFLQFIFRPWENKGKRLIQNLVRRELHRLYWDYLSKYRPLLLEGHADPGTLFLNRQRKPMTQEQLTDLYGRLTQQHLRRRGTPHLNRDSYAAHVLETGDSIVALQQALWHKDLETTLRYCRLFNASHGAVALSRNFAKTFGSKSKKVVPRNPTNSSRNLQAIAMVARKDVPVSRNGGMQSSVTLDRLLTRIRHRLPRDPHTAYRCTARHLAKCLKKKLDKVKISEIVDIDGVFGKYLAKLGPEKDTIEEHRRRLHKLLRCARQLGIAPGLFALENQWEPVRLAVKGQKNGQSIVKDALKRRIPVAQYSDEHLDEWGRDIRSYPAAQNAKSQFRLILRRTGLAKKFRSLNVQLRRNPSIRLRLNAMKPSLRREIKAILKWMRTDAQHDVIRMSKETESTYVKFIEQFCGYGVHIRKSRPPARLASLLKWDYVSKYVKWLQGVAKCQKRAIAHRLVPFELLLRFHPRFSKKLDKSICRRALALIDNDEESDLILSRGEREIHQSALLRIVQDLTQERETKRGLSRKERAWLCHDHLLMLFFACFPWPPLCLRTCRLKGPSPNIFKRQIPKDGPTVRPYPPRQDSSRPRP